MGRALPSPYGHPAQTQKAAWYAAYLLIHFKCVLNARRCASPGGTLQSGDDRGWNHSLMDAELRLGF